jgi:DNA-binding CsgD family transcriptional regulator
MTQSVRPTTRPEREAFRSIKRACYAGLDSASLRREVARRTAGVVPVDAYALMSTDPETGLFTHGVLERLPERFVRTFMDDFYLDEVIRFAELARSGRCLALGHKQPYQEVLRTHGMEHTAHVALCVDDTVWGTWCLFREAGSRPFGTKEARFLRVVQPHVARGMRAAAALDAAAECTTPESAPGVLVLDDRARVVLRSGAAAEHLQDLADLGRTGDGLPYGVVSVLTKLRLRPPCETGPLPMAAQLRAQGRSGRWYVLHASRAEPDAHGDSATCVVIEPAAPEPASALALRYGLTPREHEVLRFALRGDSAKRIAGELGLSVHTVQEHLGNACGKIGVQGRKGLLAKMFADSLTPAHA